MFEFCGKISFPFKGFIVLLNFIQFVQKYITKINLNKSILCLYIFEHLIMANNLNIYSIYFYKIGVDLAIFIC